jgi:hypothetical protein
MPVLAEGGGGRSSDSKKKSYTVLLAVILDDNLYLYFYPYLLFLLRNKGCQESNENFLSLLTCLSMGPLFYKTQYLLYVSQILESSFCNFFNKQLLPMCVKTFPN